VSRTTSQRENPSERFTWRDPLEVLRIHHALRTTFVGHIIYLYRQVESTNRTGLKLAAPSSTPSREPSAEGTLILAEAQTQGRGRMGRTWFSPPGVNIYASLILRPRIPAPKAPLITCLTASSIVQAIHSSTGIKAEIKWPNDILIRGKKVGGILTELGTVHDQVDYLVIGIGLNVNLESKNHPAEIRETATTLKTEIGRHIDRNQIIAVFCNLFEERYLNFLNDGGKSTLEEFRNLTTTLGKKVRIILADNTLEGWAGAIDQDGSLILRTAAGTQEVIRSGDIIHLRNGEH
jgi:BirA family transcriptional regulator, biotin operon repressor / biotin---[acetyl-CoA-carboxylase] ligase